MTLLLSAIGAVIAAAAIGALILMLLARGRRGPDRFAVSRPQEVTQFLDREASWAATVTVKVSPRMKPDELWALISTKQLFGFVPLVSGPVVEDDGSRTVRALLFAFREQVLESETGRLLVTAGRGVSVPLTIAAFAQRFVVSDGDGTSVTWTVAITPKWVGWFPLRWTAFAVRPFMKVFLWLALQPDPRG